MDITAKELNRIMRAAVLDEQFKEQLFADPEGVMRSQGMTLSQASLANLEAGIKWIKATSRNQMVPTCAEC